MLKSFPDANLATREGQKGTIRRLLFFLVLLSLLFTSCLTTQTGTSGSPELEYPEAIVASIENMISLKSPSQAFILLEKGKLRLDPDRVSELHIKIKDLFFLEYRTALASGTWEQADTLLRSIEAIWPDYNSAEDRKKIQQGFFSQFMEAGSVLPALILLSDTGFRPQATPVQIDQLIAHVSLTCDKEAASMLMSRFTLSADQKKVLDDVKTKTVARSSQLKGVVTIYVQKGIKIEKGVGVADMMIGTGFFIDGQGRILTNYHVISTEVDPRYEGYSRLYISLSSDPKTKILAKVLSWDPILDLAVIQAQTVPEYAFPLAAHNDLEPGQSVMVIGSPLGLENTLTSGIVSALNRRFLALGDTVQIDAPVNPGNSGGPVILSDGSAGGVIFAGAEGFEGINFMIPAVWVRKQIPNFYRGGLVPYSWLGLGGIEKSSNLVVSWNKDPASFGGPLSSGSVIYKLNGLRVDKVEKAQNLVCFSPSGVIYRIETGPFGEKGPAYAISETRDPVPLEKVYHENADYLFWPLLFGFRAEQAGTDFFGRKFTVSEVFEGSTADDLGLSVNDPILIKASTKDAENKIIMLLFEVKRQKAGFLNTGLQIMASLDSADLF